MYEVHPDNTGKWILYQTGDGGFDVVAWFAEKADAEFAQLAFETRDGQVVVSPSHMGTSAPAVQIIT